MIIVKYVSITVWGTLVGNGQYFCCTDTSLHCEYCTHHLIHRKQVVIWSKWGPNHLPIKINTNYNLITYLNVHIFICIMNTNWVTDSKLVFLTKASQKGYLFLSDCFYNICNTTKSFFRQKFFSFPSAILVLTYRHSIST